MKAIIAGKLIICDKPVEEEKNGKMVYVGPSCIGCV